MSLHCSPKDRQIIVAKNYPPVMKITFTVTNLPLISYGAYSAKYTGTTIAASPTPHPTTNLPIKYNYNFIIFLLL